MTTSGQVDRERTAAVVVPCAAGARDPARRILTSAFEDWDWARLPPRLSGLYYLWRSLRPVGKFARPRRHG